MYNEKLLDILSSVKYDDRKFFVKIIYDIVKPKTVIDIGCGIGGWSLVFKNEYGCNITGVDGDYLDRTSLIINNDEFIPYDLEKHFKFNPKNTKDKFDLAVSLEVAEHLSPSRGLGFIDDLTELSDAVFFSAAVPHQGGLNHINEKPISYWVELFEQRDLVPISCIRPIFKECVTDSDILNTYGLSISSCYANNAILYVKKDKLKSYNINPDDYVDDYKVLSFMQFRIMYNIIFNDTISKQYIMIPRNKLMNAISKFYNKYLNKNYVE